MNNHTVSTQSQIIRTQRDVLLRPLQIVSGIIERRSQLPVLAQILASKSGGSGFPILASKDAACETAATGAPCMSDGADVASAGDGSEDGEGDPESDCRRSNSSPPSPASPPSSAACAIERSSIPDATSTPNPPASPPPRNQLAGARDYPTSNDIRLAALLVDFISYRRQHWITAGLTILSFSMAIVFALMDKDWLAALALTEPIASLASAFLYRVRDT